MGLPVRLHHGRPVRDPDAQVIQRVVMQLLAVGDHQHVLDAEAGLAGARALLLASRVEARLARARHALALHQPIEGLTP